MAQINSILHAEEIVQDAGGDIAHVGGAFAQVIVFDGGEGRGVALGDSMKGVLGIDLFLLDDADDFIQEGAVFEDQQVRVKDAAFLGAHAFADFALDVEELVPGLDEGLFEAIDFLDGLAIGELAFGDGLTRFANDKDLSAAHPGRDRDAPESLFFSERRLWHGQFLPNAAGVEKQFLAEKIACQKAGRFRSLSA